MNIKIIKYGLAALLLLSSFINLFQSISLLLFGENPPGIRTFCIVVAMFFFSLALIQIAKDHFWTILISTLLFVALWLLTGIRHPHLISLLKENAHYFFIECLPYFWIFSYCSKNLAQKENSYAFFYLLLKIYRFKLVLALITQTIMFVFPSSNIFVDYMDAANALLVGLVFVTVDNLKNQHKKMEMTILEALGIIYILILGSRGGVMCYASTYLLFFIFIKKNKTKMVLIGAIALFAIYLMLPQIISVFGDSRYVQLFKEGALFHDEQRALISEILLLNIVQNPWGAGIMADRYILTNSTEIWGVSWAHNLFLELGIDFGYIGIVAGFLFLSYILYNFKKKEIVFSLIVIPLFSSSIFKLLVSSSLWQDPIFWALAGVVFTSSYYQIDNAKIRITNRKKDI